MGIPERKAGEVKINLTLIINGNGILQATSEILGTDVVQQAEIDYEVTAEHNAPENELLGIL